MIIIYLLTFVLAACSLLYELLIAQTLASIASNTVIWYSLTIGLYLGSMGLGALLCPRLFKDKDPWHGLWRVEILLSLCGGLVVPALLFTHTAYIFLTGHLLFPLASTLLLCVYMLIVLTIGILTGLELPLLIGIARDQSGTKPVTNRVLCADYIGSLAGGLIFPLMLLPKLELLSIGYAIALINVSAALFILIYYIRKITAPRAAVLAGLYFLLFVGLAGVGAGSQYVLKREYYYKHLDGDAASFFGPLNNFPDIEKHRSVYQTIDIVKIPDQYNQEDVLRRVVSGKYAADPDFPRGTLLFLNHAFQFTSEAEESYHEYLVHVPVSLNASVPRNVLVLGAGDGLLVRELLKYPQVEQITLVDLDQKIIDLANSHPVFTRLNKNSLKHPKVKIITGDAYYFIKKNTQRYDAVYIDFPVANTYALSKLYSREFFSFVRRSLIDGGYAAFESSRIRTVTQEEENGRILFKYTPNIYWDIYLNTVKAAGFDTVIPFFSNFNGSRSILKQTAYDFLDQNKEAWKKMATEGTDGPVDYKEVQGRVAGTIADNYIAKNLDGFIMMKKGKGRLNREFVDRDIPLYVLNKETFHDAFAFNDQFKENISTKFVNSIMRPLLPRALYLKVYEK